jgi:hypothetical protein
MQIAMSVAARQVEAGDLQYYDVYDLSLVFGEANILWITRSRSW